MIGDERPEAWSGLERARSAPAGATAAIEAAMRAAAKVAVERDAEPMSWAASSGDDPTRAFSDRIARVSSARRRADAAPRRLRERATGLASAEDVRESFAASLSFETAATNGDALEPGPADPCWSGPEIDDAYSSFDYDYRTGSARIDPDPLDRLDEQLDGVGEAPALWTAAALRRAPASDVVFLGGLAAVFAIFAVGALAPLFVGAPPVDGRLAVAPQIRFETGDANPRNAAVEVVAVSEPTRGEAPALGLCAQRRVEFPVAGAGAPPDMALSRLGPLRALTCGATIVADAYATRSIAPYLDAEALSRLLAERPKKCVIDAIGAPEAFAGCSELTNYRPERAAFTRSSPLEDGAWLEVNGAYSIEDGALCHHASGLTALVIGADVDDMDALKLEHAIEAQYRAAPGRKICHRLRPTAASDGRTVYVADVMIDGEPAQDRTDPRLFEMRARL